MAINFSEKDKEKIKNDKPEIYTKHTEETYAEYVKNLKKRKKGNYFTNSYLKFIIVTAIVIIGVMYFIRDTSAKPDVVLSVAIEGDIIESGQLKKFAEIIEDELNFDIEHEKADIFCITDNKQLQTLLYTGGADVVISPAEKFSKWAEEGYFLEPGTKEELLFYNDLPEEQKYYSKYKKETKKGQGGSKLYNYGIYLTGTDKYTEELSGYTPAPVAGISSSSENTINAALFLRYMVRD